jgi:hypothetical protein
MIASDSYGRRDLIACRQADDPTSKTSQAFGRLGYMPHDPQLTRCLQRFSSSTKVSSLMVTVRPRVDQKSRFSLSGTIETRIDSQQAPRHNLQASDIRLTVRGHHTVLQRYAILLERVQGRVLHNVQGVLNCSG